jgi:hypothetical protein
MSISSKPLDKTEVVSVEIPNNSIQSDHPMLRFAGIFKDDPDFADVVASLKKERAITEIED